MNDPTPNPQVPTNPQLPSPKGPPPLGAGKKSNKPYDIRERTLQFALKMLEITGALPETSEGRVVRQQLAASGTSIGSNVEEADGAVSKADKRKSLIVARKEAREVRYWLRIIQRKWPDRVRVEDDIAESTELLNILSTIVTRLE